MDKFIQKLNFDFTTNQRILQLIGYIYRFKFNQSIQILNAYNSCGLDFLVDLSAPKKQSITFAFSHKMPKLRHQFT